MQPEELKRLTDEELRQAYQKTRSNRWVNAFLVGLFIGVVVYAVVKNGFTFFTFFPLVFIYFIIKNETNNQAILKELQARNLHL
ncbi:MAG TPA: hypothetical protein DHW15_06460 [Bacteroidetes bacterium]|jgi:hypothetical protein|nr:MAG: hypothetical protein ABR94_07280 [Sphingobacteriales bacterium BACL12 MAG-120802-bin5]KRP13663.1 MAG: hypothetical protein ABR95_04775 [Sphingobacteriales bacterium BACL12 MAG-120813-bin55]HCK21800.1 hypothetical protein [Bacteroidota bacterium]